MPLGNEPSAQIRKDISERRLRAFVIECQLTSSMALEAFVHYPICIEWGDEVKATGIQIPDIPGAITAGDTFELAYNAAIEIAHLLLREREVQGLCVPIPSEVDVIRNAAQAAGKGWGMITI